MKKGKFLKVGIVVAIIVVLVLVGCLLLQSNTLSYSAQGKKNAVNYISEKYGFKAKVLKVVCLDSNNSPIPFATSTATGYVYADMEYEGKEFRVYISALKETTEGYDNYQADSIEAAIKQSIAELAGDAVQIELCYGAAGNDLASTDKSYGLVHAYYDGTNLGEVLESSYNNHAVISVANTDLDAITYDLMQESFGENMDYTIINYRSREDFKKAESEGFVATGSLNSADVEEYATYIEGYKLFKNAQELVYKKYALEQ